MKRRISLLLAAAMLVTTLGGCAPAAAPAATPAPTPAPTSAQKTSINGFNSDMFAADTVMMKVEGQPVYWSEYLYWLASNIYYIYQSIGYYPTDWTTMITENTDIRGYVLDAVSSAIAMYRAVEKKAAEKGIKLDQADMAEIDADIQKGIDYYETKEAYDNYLKSSYLDEDLYRYMLKVSILYKKLFTDMFGANAEKLSDADTMAFANKQGYMKAKHIYMSSSDPDKDAEVKAKMQSMLDQLRAETDATKRLALFDQLMTANSQDPGLQQYPNGYVFKDGDMDPNFESATKSLDNGGISDVVKSSMGYHIILRLPLGPDDSVISKNGASDEGLDTVRYYAAYDTFQTVVDGWVKDTKTESTDAVKNIDLTKIYK